jgi:hypothetical protein
MGHGKAPQGMAALAPRSGCGAAQNGTRSERRMSSPYHYGFAKYNAIIDAQIHIDTLYMSVHTPLNTFGILRLATVAIWLCHLIILKICLASNKSVPVKPKTPP